MIGVDSHPFCIPLIVESLGEIEATLEKHGHETRYLEVWLEYMRDRTPEKVVQLARAHPGRFVFHFRRRELAPIETSLQDRLAFWGALLPFDVFIDLDVNSQRSEIDFVRSQGRRATGIASYHNYAATPSLPALRAIARRLHLEWPDAVVKLATFCTSPDESESLIRLERELTEEAISHIVVGMGEYGRVTRIAGARGGNLMNFTPLTLETRSAAGQIPLGAFREELERAETAAKTPES